MSLVPKYPDGYYDKDGAWQRTKFCFVYCGENCTCEEPVFGRERLKAEAKVKFEKEKGNEKEDPLC